MTAQKSCAPHGPLAIKLETPNYVVRTLEPEEATEPWQDWLNDPATMRNLNAPPTTMSRDQIKEYIESHDRVTGHLLGIFAKETGQLVGIRAIYIDPECNEFLVNILIGERDARGKGARSETRTVIYRFFFEELGLDSARCSVVASNDAILRVMDRQGWVREHTSLKPAASGEGFVELHHFRLTRAVWRRTESERT
jgi:RimJ/RimL family protein N-acetyltransferase